MTTIANKSQHEQMKRLLSSKKSMCSQFSLFPPLYKLKWVRSQIKIAYIVRLVLEIADLSTSVRGSTLLGSVSGSHPLCKGLYLGWISIQFTPTSVRGSTLFGSVSCSHPLCKALYLGQISIRFTFPLYLVKNIWVCISILESYCFTLAMQFHSVQSLRD